MIDEKRRKEAKNNLSRYLAEGLISKERNDIAQATYIKNAELSLNLAI